MLFIGLVLGDQIILVTLGGRGAIVVPVIRGIR